jgi:hypothetical protein
MMSVLEIRRVPSALFLLLPLLLFLPAAPLHAADKIGNVTNTRPLSFGRFVADTGGTITLTTVGGRSKTGGVVPIGGGTVSSASFSLTETGSGKSLNFREITIPTTAVTMSNGTSSMTISNFVSDPNTTVLGTGKTVVLVGATLTVAPNQASGTYTGSFEITVNYQ